MNLTLWILQSALAALFAVAGLLKLSRPLPVLNDVVGGWVHDVPLQLIRTIGGLEVAGALALVLPAALGIAPWLTWLAAVGLIATMVGGGAVHARRGETREVAFNVVLALLLAAVVWGRLGPHAF